MESKSHRVGGPTIGQVAQMPRAQLATIEILAVVQVKIRFKQKKTESEAVRRRNLNFISAGLQQLDFNRTSCLQKIVQEQNRVGELVCKAASRPKGHGFDSKNMLF